MVLLSKVLISLVKELALVMRVKVRKVFVRGALVREVVAVDPRK